jgi:hypothetical protein
MWLSQFIYAKYLFMSLYVSPCFSSLLGFISSLPQLAWDKRLCCCCCCCKYLLLINNKHRSKTSWHIQWMSHNNLISPPVLNPNSNSPDMYGVLISITMLIITDLTLFLSCFQWLIIRLFSAFSPSNDDSHWLLVLHNKMLVLK